MRLDPRRPRPWSRQPAAVGGAARHVPRARSCRVCLPLARYATLQAGERTADAGYTEASRGCKHRCRHCPIVPVYDGRFRDRPGRDRPRRHRRRRSRPAPGTSPSAIPTSSTASVTRWQCSKGSRRRFPGVSYDVTIKVEHLRRHADRLPLLRDTGCAFVTSAVESVRRRRARGAREGAHARRLRARRRAVSRSSASRWRRRSSRSRRGRRSRATAICCRRSIGWASSTTCRRSSSRSGCSSPRDRGCSSWRTCASVIAAVRPALADLSVGPRDPRVDRLQKAIEALVGVTLSRAAGRRLRARSGGSAHDAARPCRRRAARCLRCLSRADHPVSERTLVLLSRADVGAGCSDLTVSAYPGQRFRTSLERSHSGAK